MHTDSISKRQPKDGFAIQISNSADVEKLD